MPAPKPTHRNRVVERCRSTGRSVPMQTSTMESYNSVGAPCFAGECLVHMHDGSKKQVSEIKKGDVVMTAKMPATVRCVLKTNCKNPSLVKIGNLLVTPWHPININGWTFPIANGIPSLYDYEAVYSFLLEEGHVSMIIENVECITFAHGIENDPVASHPFFGTQKVVKALEALEGYDDGCVVLNHHEAVIRHTETCLVCGFNQ